jgi:predicted TPR repeat methyltransferase
VTQIGTLAAQLAARERRWSDAASELDEVLARAPAENGARKLRADVRMHLNDVQGAAQDAADAVISDPDDPEAKTILGIILIECGRPEDAAICLTEALAALPDKSAVWLALARAREMMGTPDLGIATLQHGLKSGVRQPEMLNALLLAFIRRGRFAEAIALGTQAGEGGALDATGFGLLGHALSSVDRHGEALDAYREAHKLAPEDPYLAHLLATSEAVVGKDRAPEDDLRAAFDEYAERFELHLISLGYRVPGLMRHAVTELRASWPEALGGPTLDLGCGTGLVGLTVGDLVAGPLTGVDLSRRMLQLAAAKNLYARLERAEALQFLRDETTVWRLILAGDVLSYFGALDELFALVARRMSPDGLFLFSVEALEPAESRDWRLGRQARLSHSETYLRSSLAAAGLEPVLFRNEIMRKEAEGPVEGFLVGAGQRRWAGV